MYHTEHGTRRGNDGEKCSSPTSVYTRSSAMLVRFRGELGDASLFISLGSRYKAYIKSEADRLLRFDIAAKKESASLVSLPYAKRPLANGLTAIYILHALECSVNASPLRTGGRPKINQPTVRRDRECVCVSKRRRSPVRVL